MCTACTIPLVSLFYCDCSINALKTSVLYLNPADSVQIDQIPNYYNDTCISTPHINIPGQGRLQGGGARFIMEEKHPGLGTKVFLR